ALFVDLLVDTAKLMNGLLKLKIMQTRIESCLVVFTDNNYGLLYPKMGITQAQINIKLHTNIPSRLLAVAMMIAFTAKKRHKSVNIIVKDSQ
ncbi:hypothetical protein ACJX0J_023084, partial [Zea mays]